MCVCLREIHSLTEIEMFIHLSKILWSVSQFKANSYAIEHNEFFFLSSRNPNYSDISQEIRCKRAMLFLGVCVSVAKN